MERSDVIILGGGLVGLAFAAALDASGLTAILIDPADPDARLGAGFDGRATALASSSKRMFDAVGISDHFAQDGCPIRRIEVADGLAPGGLSFDPGADDEPLGWMHENRYLRAALRARAEAGQWISLLWQHRAERIERGEYGVSVTMDDGSLLQAPLLVVAEGRNSPTRDAAGIRMARWKYDHAAIVSTLRHALPHDNVAHEIFYPSGPFALLPMSDDGAKESGGGHRSAIVWSVAASDAPGFLSLSDEDFAAEAEAAMGGFLGPIETIAPRSSFPLGFHHAAQIVSNRLALIGDAAHGIHPIAGQGVNLGYRDAAALAQVLVEGARLGLDLGDRQLLDRYQRWRGLDTAMVAIATDSLARIYGVRGKTASRVRRFGMGLIDRIGPVKQRLMAEARGTSGDLPLLLQGLSI